MNGIYPKLLQVSFSCSVCEDHQPSDQQGVTAALVVWVTTSHVCFTTTSSAQWESVLVVGSQNFAIITPRVCMVGDYNTNALRQSFSGHMAKTKKKGDPKLPLRSIFSTWNMKKIKKKQAENLKSLKMKKGWMMIEEWWKMKN